MNSYISSVSGNVSELDDDYEEFKEEYNQTIEDLTKIITDETTAREEADNLKADKSDTYTKAEVDAKVSSVYRVKGSVASYASLPASGQVVGDVYNLLDTGSNYVWTESGWDKLSETVDLSGYYTKDEIDDIIENAEFDSYLTKDEASTTYATKDEVGSTYTAGDGITIEDNVISVDEETVRPSILLRVWSKDTADNSSTDTDTDKETDSNNEDNSESESNGSEEETDTENGNESGSDNNGETTEPDESEDNSQLIKLYAWTTDEETSNKTYYTLDEIPETGQYVYEKDGTKTVDRIYTYSDDAITLYYAPTSSENSVAPTFIITYENVYYKRDPESDVLIKQLVDESADNSTDDTDESEYDELPLYAWSDGENTYYTDSETPSSGDLVYTEDGTVDPDNKVGTTGTDTINII
jgi:hypothetical protein